MDEPIVDIVPELLEAIQRDFQTACDAHVGIKDILQRIAGGTANQRDMHRYSTMVGEVLAEVLKKHFQLSDMPDEKLWWNIAERTIKPMLVNNHSLVISAAETVQKAIDKAEGIGLAPVKPKISGGRVKGILEAATKEGITQHQLTAVLDAPIVTISQSFYDDFIRENVRFREKAGMKPAVIRTLGGEGCAWCQNLKGIYVAGENDYPADLYRRHERCRCTVTFTSNRKNQDVWSKAKWITGEDREKAVAEAKRRTEEARKKKRRR